ncbi:MAG TPA: hypothetical protein VGZ02_01205 [Candidatus Baltobacteraceae bacterium]|jgi:hypothetical protein|nr:hypothetical protein [Candidatus Baltobacteraceae bacterium]
MTRGAATVAILRARLHKEARVLILGIGACALLAYLQRYDGVPLQIAGSLVFGSLSGISASLIARGSGRFGEIDLCELSAPLYGRELARATALVPCILASAALSAYWTVAAIYAHVPAGALVLSIAIVNAATLVALRAGLASGWHKALWVAAACAVAGGGYALSKAPIAVAIGACVLVGFLALRQYGEALARYDPLDGLYRRRGRELL